MIKLYHKENLQATISFYFLLHSFFSFYTTVVFFHLSLSRSSDHVCFKSTYFVFGWGVCLTSARGIRACLKKSVYFMAFMSHLAGADTCTQTVTRRQGNIISINCAWAALDIVESKADILGRKKKKEARVLTCGHEGFLPCPCVSTKTTYL